MAVPALLPYFLCLLLTTQLTLTTLTIAFIPTQSPLRLAVLAAHIACLAQALSISLPSTGKVITAAVAGALSVSFAFQYLHVGVIEGWGAESSERQETAGAKRPDRNVASAQQGLDDAQRLRSGWESVKFGCWAAVTTRQVGTELEVKGIPKFDERRPGYVPSTGRFLGAKLLVLGWCYLVVDALSVAGKPEMNEGLFCGEKISLTNPDNRSFEALITRAASTFGFWVSLYCIIQFMMSSLAILSVVSGLSKVESWPPGFGPVTEAYTVRRFWGVFWHKYQQQKMAGPASFIADSLLHLHPHSSVSRYTQLSLTFLFSGLMHAASDIAQGLSWRESGAIRFFCTQVVGIAVEDSVRAILEETGLESRKRSRGKRGLKVLGFLWVAGFLVWSTPAWIYPSLCTNRGGEKDSVVPYSVVGAFRKYTERNS